MHIVSAKLEPSRTTERTSQVGTGVAVPLMVALGVAGVAHQVDVVAETPVIEVKRQTTQTNVTLDELQNIPSSRDPWVVLQTVPGVIVDRVNVGGSESGQQSDYKAKGASDDDNTWNLDGIPITDMGALGASPTYYDFDMFQEMQVTTGGADAANPTPGVQLNFVLKSGTNTPHGSARLLRERAPAGEQPAGRPRRRRPAAEREGNRLAVADYGCEVAARSSRTSGGPGALGARPTSRS